MTRVLLSLLLTVAASYPGQTTQTVQRPGETARSPVAPQSDATEATAIIRGHVTGADGRPLRQASVTLTQEALRQPKTETTDANGLYEFSGLPAGTYSLTTSKTGYATVEYAQRRMTDPGRPVKVGDGETLERIDFVLPRAAAISGRVTDENGDPIEGASVSIYTVKFVNGRRQLVHGGANRRTNDLGRFRAFSLDPGQYVIGAAAATDGTHRLPGYAPMFFPDTPSVADAQVIAVGPGEDLTSMEIRLTPGRATTVSGVALDASGQLFQRPLLLSTSQRSGVLATPAVHVTPQADGRFAFLNVAPGDYVLQAFTRGTNGAEFATQFVGVGDGDVTGLTVRTATGSTVSGHIRLEGVQSRAAPQDVQFNFVETDADLSPEGGTFRAKINDDWTFEYEGLFGPLLVRPIGRPGFLLKSVSVNGADVTDAVLPFGRRNQSLSDVEVVLTSRSAEATGSVADARAQPALACTVIVFPADRERWQPYSRFVKAARCDPDGTFTVRGLPTAEYLVVAVDRLQGSFASDSTRSGDWQDPAFLAALAPHAVRATLTEGQTATVSLKLITR